VKRPRYRTVDEKSRQAVADRDRARQGWTQAERDYAEQVGDALRGALRREARR
jgi:hypothetical protein